LLLAPFSDSTLRYAGCDFRPMATFTVGSLTERLTSLDAFRGLTVASMMLVNNPGDWGDIYPPLEHAAWSGWTFTDIIFPFFLWMVGVALTLSTAKRIEQGANREKLLAHVVRRSVLIFALGLFLAGFPYFHLSHIRIPGVLPRIAVCYFIASLIFLYSKWRTQVASIVVLFASYWLLMMLVPLPCAGTSRFDINCNFARYVDGLLLSGHMWSQTKVWDPEGIVSTLPAIATTLFGVLTGTLLRQKLSSEKKAIFLLGIGAGLFALGQVANIWMPINKSLWTVSFSLLMAGLATMEFAVLYWVIDIRGYRKWATPLVIYGTNAIVVFVLSGVVGRLLGLVKVTGPDGQPEDLVDRIYQTVFLPLASPINASLLYAIAFVALFFLISWFLYRRRWFVRL
jgi:predicted acyltransferase